MPSQIDHHEILSGFIRLHVLHHAAEGELYGKWMIEELAHHGYNVSPGTLYPMLHSLEKKGYLSSRKERDGRTFRRVYTATPLGRQALEVVSLPKSYAGEGVTRETWKRYQIR